MSRFQKGKTNLDFTEARDSEWQGATENASTENESTGGWNNASTENASTSLQRWKT